MGDTIGDATVAEVREMLAAELRRRRVEHGLTQVALARRLGSSQSRVAKMESAEAGVTLDLLVRAVAELGASRLDIAKVIVRPMATRPGP